MRLLIVESPAKAKTINKYLGSGYQVLASYGHVRDLLSKDGSVKPDDHFSMIWELSARGGKCIKDIVQKLKKCDELLLATDPDREGEAISWHIREVLKENNNLTVPYKRIVFYEITKNAIKNAIENPRDIDQNLVDAYLARRALDYLVGFTLSPILWRKLPGSKSAGRVQSVALRIIVERENEIEAFKPEEYWTLDAKFKSEHGKLFNAHLINYNGKKLDKFAIKNEASATAIKDALLSQKYFVKSIEKKRVKRNPAPAFITSTLQQEASRKLGFSAKKTMQIAQKLYEGVNIDGETSALISYMRTDSVNLSKEAIDNIRKLIDQKYGSEFVPAKPRLYQTKVKNAQEAHEAIRPIDVNYTPELLAGKIESDLWKLYSLIWKRAVASQMSSAEFDQVQVDISNVASVNMPESDAIFRANGNTIAFEGFLKVYIEGKDDAQEEEEGILPPLKEKENADLNKLDTNQHFTSPPPRYSEASLVKKLEELGIGRPSTYATIIQVLQDRGYVSLEKKVFIPTMRGRLVTSFLVSFFKKYLEYGFTADLEQSLDDVSNGSKTKLNILDDFWAGFSDNVNKTKEIKTSNVIDKLNEDLKQILFADKNGNISKTCPVCGQGELSLKISRYGSFVGCSRYPDCNYVRKLDVAQGANDASLSEDTSTDFPKSLGIDPADGKEITLRKGPYGFYFQKDADAFKGKDKTPAKSKKKSAKPKPIRAPLPKFIDPYKCDLATAIKLIQFPKKLGTYDGDDISIGIGRFGPYILFRGEYKSVKDPEKFMQMDLETAIKMLREKKKSIA